jgi:hypothetical protein
MIDMKWPVYAYVAYLNFLEKRICINTAFYVVRVIFANEISFKRIKKTIVYISIDISF